MNLDLPNHFGQVSKYLPINFGWVQNIKISPEKSNLNLNKIIWTPPKQFGQSICNHFGSILLKNDKVFVRSLRSYL